MKLFFYSISVYILSDKFDTIRIQFEPEWIITIGIHILSYPTVSDPTRGVVEENVRMLLFSNFHHHLCTRLVARA